MENVYRPILDELLAEYDAVGGVPINGDVESITEMLSLLISQSILVELTEYIADDGEVVFLVEISETDDWIGDVRQTFQTTAIGAYRFSAVHHALHMINRITAALVR